MTLTVPNPLTPTQQIERQKLITRARGILLDNQIFTAEDARWRGDGLLGLPGLGPKSVDLILRAVNEGDLDTLNQLFPYPDGIDAPIPFEVADVEPPDETDDDAVPFEFSTVPTHFLVYAITRLENDEINFVRGYLSALVEMAEGAPGLVVSVGDILAPPVETAPEPLRHPLSQEGARQWQEFKAELEKESNFVPNDLGVSTQANPIFRFDNPPADAYESGEKGGC